MRHLATSRRALFEASERDALLPLPADPYVYAERPLPCRHRLPRRAAPSLVFRACLVHEVIEARITERTVELFHRGVRIASQPLRRNHCHNGKERATATVAQFSSVATFN